MNVVIWGTGRIYERYKGKLSSWHIIALLDNDIKKQGICIDGYSVFAPVRLRELNYDAVYILSISYMEIKQQLMEIGCEREKIFNYTDLVKTDFPIIMKIYPDKNVWRSSCMGKRILFFTHTLKISGAPRALLNTACILKKKGYLTVICAEEEGSLADEIIQAGIMLVINSNLRNPDTLTWNWIMSFDLLWFNTISWYNGIEHYIDYGKKIVWWIHEGPYPEKKKERYKNIGDLIRKGKINIFAGGDIAKEFLESCDPKIVTRNLLYGIPENRRIKKSQNGKEKICFALIGSIDSRKGQDIYCNALTKMADKFREKAEFWIIGDNNIGDDIFYQNIVEYEKKKYVKIFCGMKYEQLQKLYCNIDVVVCPSRMDPMPIVLTEGLMQEKICITSEYTGTSRLMKDKENGL